MRGCWAGTCSRDMKFDISVWLAGRAGSSYCLQAETLKSVFGLTRPSQLLKQTSGSFSDGVWGTTKVKASGWWRRVWYRPAGPLDVGQSCLLVQHVLIYPLSFLSTFYVVTSLTLSQCFPVVFFVQSCCCFVVVLSVCHVSHTLRFIINFIGTVYYCSLDSVNVECCLHFSSGNLLILQLQRCFILHCS